MTALLALATVLVMPPFALGQSSELDLGFAPGVDGAVKVICVVTNGQIYIGGSFGAVNGRFRKNMARLNSDGALDPDFYVNVDGVAGLFGTNVSAIVVQPDGRVIIGGQFLSINGTTRAGLARLMPNGSLDASFDPPITPFLGYGPGINRLLLQPNGQILGGGFFDVSGRTNWTYLQRFNSDGTVDTDFTRWGYSVFGMDDMALQSDGRIVMAASLYATNPPIYYSPIARLNPDGSVDAAYHPGQFMHETLLGVALQSDDRAVVGGAVFLYGGADRFGFGRVNLSGTLDADYDAKGAGSDSTIWRVVVQRDNKALLGGNFSRINGVSRHNLARMHVDGSLDLSFNRGAGPDGSVDCLSIQADGRVLIAGSFAHVDGIPRAGLARLYGGPSLNVARAGDSRIVLSWPTGFVGAAVQSNTNLVSGIWTPLSGVPVLSGEEMKLTNGATAPFQFFRLYQP